jgi:hypothetical protein
MPKSGEELAQALQQAQAESSPLDDFIQITKELARLELQYKLDSAEFYARFQAGQMGDALDFMCWATKYEIHENLKANLKYLLDVSAQYALPIPVMA